MAVAEPRRRQILDALAAGERSVNDLVAALDLAPPQVSKHLQVLREVGAVVVRDEGRQRLYRLNGHALKPIHDWVSKYERTWEARFSRMDSVLEELYEGIPDGEEQAAVVTVTFTELDGRTRLDMHVLHATPEGRDAHLDSGMEPGMQSALDHLERVAVELG